MAREIHIDKDECLGCESCVEICPEIFGFNEAEQKAYVKQVEGCDDDVIQEAVDSCPAGCISFNAE
ncbi:ferredoxin [Desulfothermus okinawensis JCM 13304]